MFIIYLLLYIYIAGESAPKLFVGHSIYKGKAALTVEPRSPEFSPLDVSPLLFSSYLSFSFLLSFFSSLCFKINTWQSGAYKLVKEGFVLLQFAPAAAARQYDWTRKQVTCYFPKPVQCRMKLLLQLSNSFLWHI